MVNKGIPPLLPVLFIILSSFVFCSLDNNNPVLSVRDKTVLETRIIGNWVWSTLHANDTVEFREDLTYESVKQGLSYDGTFSLASDSLLKLSRRVVLNGTEFTEYMIYDLDWLTDESFMISYHNAPMIYRRIR